MVVNSLAYPSHANGFGRHTYEMTDPRDLTDVSRDNNGRLRWHTSHGELSRQHEVVQQPLLGHYRDVFDPPVTESLDAPLPRGGTVRSLWTTSARRRSIIIGVAAFALTLVVAFMVFPQRPTAAVVQESQSATSEPVPAPSPVGSVTDAVRSFVAAGQVSRWGAMPQITEKDLIISIINKSGDLVLTDVAVEMPSGEKEFATLLLQKVEGEWQIREVY